MDEDFLKWILIIIGVIIGLVLLYVLFMFLLGLFEDYGPIGAVLIIIVAIILIGSWAAS